MGPEAHQGSGTIGPFAFWPSIGSVLDEDNPGPLRTYILGFIRRLWLFFFLWFMAFFYLLMKFKHCVKLLTFNRMFA